MDKNIHEILETDFVKRLRSMVCGDVFEIVERPAAYFVKQPDSIEDQRDINRLIILPPFGYTANVKNQTNCFHAVETATIQIRGAVREGKRAFSKIKECLMVVSFDQMDKVSHLDKPYQEFDIMDESPQFNKVTRSAGEMPFHVVGIDGKGFYHTLINTTDEWLILQLHKVMRPQKKVDISECYMGLQDEHSAIIQRLYDGIITHGDALFSEDTSLVNSVVKMPPSLILPALGEMLYIRDTGKHETCTAFALILKLGRNYPKIVTKFLKQKLQTKAIPKFFAEQLMKKIEAVQNQKAA